MAITLDGTAGITTPDLTDTSLTSGRVVYAGASGNLTGSSTFVFDGSSLGVGTSSPSNKLEVKGGNGNQLTLDNAGEAYTQMTFKSNGTNRAAIWATAAELGLYTYSTQSLIFYTNTTERARFNTTGAFVLAGGTTTADGIGITFPATQSASSNANTLDDYEEGTWTPVLSGIGSGTLSYQFGKYRKIGSLVFVVGKVTWTGKTGTDNLNITGLPFASDNASDGGQRSSAFPEGDWSGINDLMDLNGMFRANGSGLQGVIDSGSGSSVYMTSNNISSSGTFNFSLTYYTEN